MREHGRRPNHVSVADKQATGPNDATATPTGRRLAAAFPLRDTAPFPGRWVAGTVMVAGPLLMLTGVLLRAPFDFFFPEQLAAYQRHPDLMAAAYGTFIAGNVLLWPAAAFVAARIGVRCPGWALWGGVLAIFGLFARVFHAGVDHLAFQLVRSQGVESATRAVGDAYGAFHVFSVLSAAILAGWLVLAIGAWRSGVLGRIRSVALGLMATLPLGVLKGTTPLAVVAVAGLAIALVPLGVTVLRDGPRPRPGSMLRWMGLVAVVGVLMFLLGQAG